MATPRGKLVGLAHLHDTYIHAYLCGDGLGGCTLGERLPRVAGAGEQGVCGGSIQQVPGPLEVAQTAGVVMVVWTAGGAILPKGRRPTRRVRSTNRIRNPAGGNGTLPA